MPTTDDLKALAAVRRDRRGPQPIDYKNDLHVHMSAERRDGVDTQVVTYCVSPKCSR